MNKINIIPIFRDHFGTFVDSRDRVLWRDYMFFVIAPVTAGIFCSWSGLRPTAAFVDFLLLANSIFIPLIVNVLFVIYGIRERHAESVDGSSTIERKSTKLLEHLYKNLIYAVVIACFTVATLGLTKLLGMPPLDLLPIAVKRFFVDIGPLWEGTVYALAYALLIHTALTVLMVLKRTHALLGNIV